MPQWFPPSIQTPPAAKVYQNYQPATSGTYTTPVNTMVTLQSVSANSIHTYSVQIHPDTIVYPSRFPFS